MPSNYLQYIYCMIVLLVLWALYFFLHSLLASAQLKQGFQKKFLLTPVRHYRIIYNFFSLAGLITLLWLQFKQSSFMLFNHTIITYAVGIMLMIAGLMIMLISGLHYDLKSFSGITDERPDVLRKDKLNRFVRHPLYCGTTLSFIALCVIWPYNKNLYLFIIYLVYLGIGIYLEEKKLVAIYGDQYRDYQTKVKKLIPYIW